MRQVVLRPAQAGRVRPNAFSLVELLVVMAIIGILVAISLQAISAVMAAAARGRAKAEMKSMEAGLESYKIDNATYPVYSALLVTDPVNNLYNCTGLDGSSTIYQAGSQVLYQALSGRVNATDTTLTGKAYMNFKTSQISGANATYLIDPWSYSYGYSTGSPAGTAPTAASYPMNGSGLFDLWSTAGQLAGPSNNTAAWIANWQQQ